MDHLILLLILSAVIGGLAAAFLIAAYVWTTLQRPLRALQERRDQAHDMSLGELGIDTPPGVPPGSLLGRRNSDRGLGQPGLAARSWSVLEPPDYGVQGLGGLRCGFCQRVRDSIRTILRS